MGGHIEQTIKDVLAQTFTNYEIIISDNNSEDNTEEIVKSFKDKRIKFFKNETNVGYAKNLELCRQRASGDIIYLLSAKSRIPKDALMNTYRAFKLSEDIGAVTRPYYWFGNNISHPVRAKEQYSEDKDTVVSIHDGEEKVIAVFKTVDNPGGLAYKREYMDTPFHEDRFVEFVYPFASIFKKHKVVILKDYSMACPAWASSGCRAPIVYEKSPVQNWVDLFNTVFYEEEFKSIREKCIKNFVAVNYVGLVQIRNYAAKHSHLLREISLLIKYRWQNLFNLKFWVFSIGTMLMPRSILIPLVEIYKDKVNSKILKYKTRNRGICLKV